MIGRRHLKSHELFGCTIGNCSKLFKSKKELKRHIHDIHLQKGYVKTSCGIEMPKDNAIRHEKTCKRCKAKKETQI
jgi:hypothetical protein